jgi:3-hydroxybutyryl-CoA dehydrogenase
MGHGIAAVFAAAGHPVAITDISSESLSTVQERVRTELELCGRDRTAAERIECYDELDATVSEADFVFEAASEDLELKRQLFRRLATATGDAILATNTSVISIQEIAGDAVDAERILGTHWWNPPFLVPLVEVVTTPQTRPEYVERVMALLASVGKSPVHIAGDIPGFVGNRLQHALWREAFALVDAGVCDAETIDRIVKESFGLRLAVLGPMENADLVGLDLILSIHKYLLRHLDRSSEPANLLRDLVSRGALGVRTGHGFRDWKEGEADATRVRLFKHLLAASSDRATEA